MFILVAVQIIIGILIIRKRQINVTNNIVLQGTRAKIAGWGFIAAGILTLPTLGIAVHMNELGSGLYWIAPITPVALAFGHAVILSLHCRKEN
jgi:hypothetical protein